MTLGELFREGKNALLAAEVAEWELDAWYLLEYAAGCTKSSYYMHFDEPVEEEQVRKYRELIRRRGRHIPLQYLTGSQEFMGYSFLVTEDVLIPRQDTEILVEEVLKELHDGMSILDMCTGSGCILLSLLQYSNDCEGTGTDLSAKALEIAKENGRRLGKTPVFLESDLFEKVEGRYDVIVSNPPYIPTEVIPTLMPEVREYEPEGALDGKEDGLYFYREIVRQAGEYLNRGGRLFFEIGCGQAAQVSALLEEAGYKEIEVVKDFAGLDRVVSGIYLPCF